MCALETPQTFGLHAYAFRALVLIVPVRLTVLPGMCVCIVRAVGQSESKATLRRICDVILKHRAYSFLVGDYSYT
jgi:hypothetical protein